MELTDALLDLCFGGRCDLCGVPGRTLCRACRRALPTSAGPCWPTPSPPGLVRPSATGEYAADLQTLILSYKEHGRTTLAGPLGHLLGLAVDEAWSAAGRCLRGGAAQGPVLVPVPSHRAVVRARGHSPVLRMAQVAAADLREAGRDARVVTALGVTERPADQAGLGSGARRANVLGRFRASSAAHILFRSGREVVLVDDVITTGATLREAQRALEAVGVRPVGAAAVAATQRRQQRRHPPSQPGARDPVPFPPDGPLH